MNDVTTIENVLRQAEGLAIDGNPEEALKLLNGLDETGEMSGHISFIRGSTYLRMDQIELADEHLNDALNKGFVDFTLFENLAIVSLRLGKNHQAELLFRQASELAPAEIRPLEMIFQIRMALGDPEGGRGVATEMTRRHPALINGFVHLTEMLVLENKAKEAMDMLVEIEERFSANPIYIQFRAFTMAKLEKYDEALAYVEERESYFFDEGAKQLYKKIKSNLLLAMKRIDDALPLLKELYELGDRESGFAMVAEAMSRNDVEAAIKLVDEMTGDGQNDEIYYRLLFLKATMLESSGEAEGAQTVYELALNGLKESGNVLGAEMHILRANLAARLGFKKEALDDLTVLQEYTESLTEAPEELRSSILVPIEKMRETIARMEAAEKKAPAAPEAKPATKVASADAFV